jgi:hypothetical protein
MACEAAGIVPDYYVKTFHHENYWSAIPRENRREFTVDGHPQPGHNDWHDNMFDLFPDQTQEVMGKVKAPWIAFKVLAAGRSTRGTASISPSRTARTSCASGSSTSRSWRT